MIPITVGILTAFLDTDAVDRLGGDVIDAYRNHRVMAGTWKRAADLFIAHKFTTTFRMTTVSEDDQWFAQYQLRNSPWVYSAEEVEPGRYRVMPVGKFVADSSRERLR